MKAIGGYFELELSNYGHYHNDAIKLNTGRNCLEYILRARKYKKVYIPYYTCEVVLAPFQKLDVQYAFYHIDSNFEISDNICLDNNEALLYTNYYGLKSNYVKTLASKYANRLIIDNTQAFYAEPIRGIDTFYTCRKYFGVPDGAYLYTDCHTKENFPQDESFERMTFLTKRIDRTAQEGYPDFRNNDKLLGTVGIRMMSKLTEALMQGIDYRAKATKRTDNFNLLNKELRTSNLLKWDLAHGDVPLVYPYLVENGAKLRQMLIDNQIFCAQYWPNVLEWCEPDMLEYRLAKNLVCLPIDQRYGKEEMNIILKSIRM